MAQQYFSVYPGQVKENVVSATSSTSAAPLEVRVNLTTYASTTEGVKSIINSLETIIQAIKESAWPPA